MKKQILGMLSIALISTILLDRPSSLSVHASTKTPLIFGSAMSTLANMDDFVSSGYFSQADSNLKYASPPGLLTWQGAQTMHLMPAGHTIKHNSLFLKNKVDISRSERKGISTFFEFSLHKGEFQWAGDGFSLVLARDDFRTKERAGYATGSINNSVAIRFSTWRPHPINSTGLQVSVAKNGNTTDAALIGDYQNIDVALGTISPGVANYGLLRIYKMWIDLDAATGNLEIRVRFDNSYVRPTEPTVTYSNISMADLTEQFYAGITVSGGGLTLGLFLNHMYAANQYLPSGIDMMNLNQYIVDRTAPTAPAVTPLRTETGYTLSPTSTDNAGGNIVYEYKMDDAAYAPATSDTEIPFGTRQVLVRAFDSISNISTITTVNFLKVRYLDPFGETLQELWYPTSDPLEILTPSRTGYTFGGWYNEVTFENEVTQLSTSADSTLFPKWTADPYTIQFETNGGSVINDLTQGFETIVNAPTNPTKLGHTFDGWFSDESMTTPYTFSTMPMNDVTLYAKWTINPYTITFNTNEGTTINPITQDFNTSLTPPNNPTKVGYTFAGWFSDEALTNAYTFPGSMPSSNITIYAKWTINPYTITFNTNEGTSINPITQDFNTSLTAPVDPIKEGHTFAGWFSDETLTNAYTFPGTMPSSNVNVYAKWLVNAYSVRFETFGGNIINDTQISFGSQVTSVPTPTKDHAFFDGWYFDSELTQPITAFDMPAEDVTLYAAWVDATPVENLIAMVEAWPNPLNLSYAQSLLDAKALLASLTTKQGSYVPEEIRQTIERAEIHIHNLIVVANTEALFEPLPNPVTLEDAELVATLREQYNALNNDQKALFDSALLQRLVIAETRIVDLNVVASVAEQFMFNDPITLADEDDVIAIRDAYEGLTNDQKALFDEELITELERVEEILRNLRVVQNVIDLINNLTVNNMDDVGRVSQARGAYDNLTPEQQALIDDTIFTLLVEREAEATAFVNMVDYRNTTFSILIFHLLAGAGITVAFYLKKKKAEAKA